MNDVDTFSQKITKSKRLRRTFLWHANVTSSHVILRRDSFPKTHNKTDENSPIVSTKIMPKTCTYFAVNSPLIRTFYDAWLKQTTIGLYQYKLTCFSAHSRNYLTTGRLVSSHTEGSYSFLQSHYSKIRWFSFFKEFSFYHYYQTVLPKYSIRDTPQSPNRSIPCSIRNITSIHPKAQQFIICPHPYSYVPMRWVPDDCQHSKFVLVSPCLDQLVFILNTTVLSQSMLIVSVCVAKCDADAFVMHF